MRYARLSLLAAGLSMVAATGLAVPAADAATPVAATATWTVTPGGDSQGLPVSPRTYLTDTVTGAKFKCGTLYVTAYLRRGSSLPPTIGWIRTMSTTAPCLGENLRLNIQGGQTAPASWPIRANSYTPATSTAYGAIHGVNLAVSGTGCTADLTGSMTWRLQNSDDTAWTLKAAKTLSASNVTGCAGAINDGDTFTLSGVHDRLIGGGHGYLFITSP